MKKSGLPKGTKLGYLWLSMLSKTEARLLNFQPSDWQNGAML